VRAEIEGKLHVIKAKAAELMASRGDQQIKLGERLEKATQYPDDRFIFLVGDKPVIVCWGTRSERADNSVPALEKDIGPYVPRSRMPGTAQEALDADAPPQSQPARPQHAPAGVLHGRYWLLQSPPPWGVLVSMLALFFFLAAIFFSLVPACGVDGVLSPWGWRNVWCDGYAVAAREAPDAETARLEDEFDRLRSAIAATPCPTVAKQPRGAQQPQPPTESTERVQDVGGKIGEINVILKWEGRTVDLDLHVLCPGGGEISFSRRQDCGGELDVDMNYAGRYSDRPVENVVFPEGKASRGRFTVQVHKIGSAGERTPFEVVVRIRGRENSYRGVADDRIKEVATFDVD
jgi:hypothetical protein